MQLLSLTCRKICKINIWAKYVTANSVTIIPVSMYIVLVSAVIQYNGGRESMSFIMSKIW